MSLLKQKKALIFGDDTRSFLSVIRSLSKAGMVVDVVTFDNLSPALHSNHIHQIFNYNHQSITIDEWTNKVTELLSTSHYDIVIPCDERALFPLLDINDLNICQSAFAIPNRDDIAPLFDKHETRTLAQSLDVATAGGKLINLKDYSYKKLIDEFGDMAVLKPLQSFNEGHLDKRNNVAIIVNEPQFNEFKKHAAPTILAERYFSGKGVGVSVLSDQGKVKRAFAHSRVAEPLTGGGSSYRKSIPLDTGMLEACKAMCEKLNYTGVAMFEFKQNMQTREWILIEINARFWGSLPLAIYAGVDFPADYAKLLLGQDLETNFNYKINVFARQLSTDVYSMKAEFDHLRKQGESQNAMISLAKRLVAFGRILIAKEKIDSFSFFDQKPFYHELNQLFGSSLRKLPIIKYFKSDHSNPIDQINFADINDIIFVCYGNIMRSPFAEYYFKQNIHKIDAENLNVKSSGFHLNTDRSSPSVCVSCAKTFDIDLTHHRSSWLSQNDIKNQNQLIVIFDEYNEDKLKRFYKNHYVINLASLIPEQYGQFKNIDDPYGKHRKEVLKCYRLISSGIDELISRIDCSQQKNKTFNKLDVTSSKNNTLESIQHTWQTLEEKANNSYFTSWHWLGTWYQLLKEKPFLLTIKENEEVIGLGFYTIKTNRKFIFNIKQLWINRTGHQKQDQIWIEYNDFLSVAGKEKQVRKAAIDYLNQNHASIDEILIGASEQGTFACSVPISTVVSSHWDDISYQRRLKPKFSNIDEYLNELSANTRYQIKRSIKYYQQQGEIDFKFAQTKEDALNFFDRAAKFHKEKWQTVSGFHNEFFIEFHKTMIEDNFQYGVIDIIQISVNKQPISYLYNFNYKKRIYFYLSGLDYSDKKLLNKPGLVSHSLAISEYAKKGAEVYDFMGGDGQYKASLSDKQSLLQISSIRKSRTKFYLLRQGKKVRQLFK